MLVLVKVGFFLVSPQNPGAKATTEKMCGIPIPYVKIFAVLFLHYVHFWFSMKCTCIFSRKSKQAKHPKLQLSRNSFSSVHQNASSIPICLPLMKASLMCAYAATGSPTHRAQSFLNAMVLRQSPPMN